MPEIFNDPYIFTFLVELDIIITQTCEENVSKTEDVYGVHVVQGFPENMYLNIASTKNRIMFEAETISRISEQSHC